MIKIAILYSKTGGGHLSLAQAANESLAQDKYQIDIFDPFPNSLSFTHKTLSNYFTDVYRLGMKATENPKIFSAINNLNHITVVKKIRRYIDEANPQIIVSNHPLAAASVQIAISKTRFRPIVVSHICDPFTTHKSWFIGPQADHYLSPTTQMTQYCKKLGIAENKIFTIGWLSRKSYVNGPYDTLLSKSNLGINPLKFTVFLGGSGQGNSQIQDICESISHHPQLANIQCILNTGLNTLLINQVLKYVQSNPKQFLLIPYLPDISKAMSAADLVIGKAGPNFIFESIQLLKPLIITGHLPSHEDGNPNFIKKSHLGWVETSPEKLANKLAVISKNPQKNIDQITPNLIIQKNIHKDSQANFEQAIEKILSSNGIQI